MSHVRPITAILSLCFLLSGPSRAATLSRGAKDPSVIIAGPVASRVDSFMVAAAGCGMEGTLLVEREGKVILCRGYGTVDRAKHRSATTHTPYILGSLS